MKRIIIFANGELPDLNAARAILRPDDFIICADGGTRHVLALEITPNLIIGDMDSAQKDQLQELSKAGVEIELYPQDKNETDLELAIRKAVELDSQALIIVAALGGRIDQALANIALLADPRLESMDARLDDGLDEIFFCRNQVQVGGSRGDIVSLLPWGGQVLGVQTKNLKWPLNKETLHPAKTRGISNEMLSETASIQIESGLLLVIHRRQSKIEN